MQAVVDCLTHGRKPVAFVCQHLARSLLTRIPVGFFWSIEDRREFPDAWCAACNERHIRCGYQWSGEALDQLGASALCTRCYLNARLLNLGR